MKMVKIECPGCGAQMRFDPETKQAHCDFCGKVVLIDDEVQHFQFDNAEEAGYQFEKGRQKAQNEWAIHNEYNTIVNNNVEINQSININESTRNRVHVSFESDDGFNTYVDQKAKKSKEPEPRYYGMTKSSWIAVAIFVLFLLGIVCGCYGLDYINKIMYSF